MTDQEQRLILIGYGEYIVAELKSAIKDKQATKFGAVNASGDLYNSIRYEVDNKGLRVYALDYIFNVEYGRAPGKFPPREAILKWIDEKNLTFDIPVNSLAFLIARKIARKGTEAFIQGGTDIVADVITPNLIEEIRQEFAGSLIYSIESDLLKAYQIAA